MVIRVEIDIEVEDNINESSIEKLSIEKLSIEELVKLPVINKRLKVYWSDIDAYKKSTRIKIVKNALNVEINDAEKIVEYLDRHGHVSWIDEYDIENNKNEPLVDIHSEPTLDDMVYWLCEDEDSAEGDNFDILELENMAMIWHQL